MRRKQNLQAAFACTTKDQFTRDLENYQSGNWYWVRELERKCLYGDRDVDAVERGQGHIDAVSAMVALLLKLDELVELIQLSKASGYLLGTGRDRVATRLRISDLAEGHSH